MKGQIRIQDHIGRSIQKAQQGATQTCSPTGDDWQFSESLFGCFSNLESGTDVSSRFFRFLLRMESLGRLPHSSGARH
jgi:hypothetical protein